MIFGGSDFCHSEFVGLGENDGEGDSVVAEELDEGEVYLLGIVADVDEDKEAGELLTVEHIAVDHVFQFFHLFLAALCISVAWEVDDVP